MRAFCPMFIRKRQVPYSAIMIRSPSLNCMDTKVKAQTTARLPLSVDWCEGRLHILDQTLLPNQVEIAEMTSIEDVEAAIKGLRVRGAPAIGIAAAYGMVLGLSVLSTPTALCEEMRRRAEFLISARPTAVNLGWACKRMLEKAEASKASSTREMVDLLEREAVAIHDEDREICVSIGNYGRSLLKDGMNVLTHCNAGSLAVSELGTALAPIYSFANQGGQVHVYADETRPLLQGARLTCWELVQNRIPVTLICDNMAAQLMSDGKVDLVLVGTDRVAANGDTANKIGTLGLAILADYFSIPFYVACPSSTLDLDLPSGAQIPIEVRADEEVSFFNGHRIAPRGVAVYNPAFDVTPHALITGFVTDQGIIKPPFAEKLGIGHERR